ncbi:MAG: hypothetical protein AB1635_09955 [Acidobacteriota bacterium]
MRLLIGLAAGLALVAAACTRPGQPAPVEGSAPPSRTFGSLEALGEAVLDAIAAGDRAALAALALSEAEFRQHVWPELPASRPARNLPVEYVWGQLAQRSAQSLEQTLARYGGRRYRLERVSFAGETTRYATFDVRRDTEIIATDDTGRTSVLRLFGATLVRHGRFQVFSFVIAD